MFHRRSLSAVSWFHDARSTTVRAHLREVDLGSLGHCLTKQGQTDALGGVVTWNEKGEAKTFLISEAGPSLRRLGPGTAN
jgi:hypothetical protein